MGESAGNELERPFVCAPLERVDLLDPEAVHIVFRLVPDAENEILDVVQGAQLCAQFRPGAKVRGWQAAAGGAPWVCTFKMPADRYTVEDRLEVARRVRQKFGLGGGDPA